MASGEPPLRHTVLAEEADPPRVEVITPTAAQQLLQDGWTYLDVRTPEEYANGHAPGAINVPLMVKSAGEGSGLVSNPSFLEQVRAAFPDKDAARIVVACQIGKRAAMAASLLQSDGYSHLRDIQDGFGHWSAAGLPVEK